MIPHTRWMNPLASLRTNRLGVVSFGMLPAVGSGTPARPRVVGFALGQILGLAVLAGSSIYGCGSFEQGWLQHGKRLSGEAMQYLHKKLSGSCLRANGQLL